MLINIVANIIKKTTSSNSINIIPHKTKLSKITLKLPNKSFNTPPINLPNADAIARISI